ncbi:hypothetical protein [Aliikangiella maris]|uniref:Uncharacterized protein n=2 Tax=Aliikangiella maris TaxID=3162458 RepID=A0ABV3MVI7_9GAMM
MKVKFAIFFALIIILLIIVLDVYLDYNKARNFGANGVVVDISWKSKNHGMPLILIKEQGELKSFSSERISLKEGQLNVGDSFNKKSGSKSCLINMKKIVCVK